jgi:hypothetical protein
MGHENSSIIMGHENSSIIMGHENHLYSSYKIVWNAPKRREEINNQNLFSKQSLWNASQKVKRSFS